MMNINLNPRFLLLAASALAVPAAADWVARKVAGKGYEIATGEEPPRNPAVVGVGWKEALLWTAIAGAIGGIARMASRKILTEKGIHAKR